VRPPSARFLVELFLVPGLIVAIIIGIWLFLMWLFGGARTPESFLRGLDDANPEQRWRAAADLAQTLPRSDRLAADADFALKLCERLQRAIRDNAANEAALLKKLPTLSDAERVSERGKLDKEREYLQYLAAGLGRFMAPVGLPLIRQLAEQDSGIEPQALAVRRRRALFALATLGDSLTRFDKLHPTERAVILNTLNKAKDDANLRGWAAVAETILVAREEGRSEAPGVDQTLAKCAAAEDPVLREYAAFAANYWIGNDAERKKIDEILVKLAADDGRGDALREALAGPEPEGSSKVRETPGLIVRINALIALCRRGSPLLDAGHLQQIKGLLDEDRLGRDLQLIEAGGKEQPNKAKVAATLVALLQAVAKLHHQAPDRDLGALVPSIEALTGNGNVDVATAAREALAELRAK
jgi:hypothetical protein